MIAPAPASTDAWRNPVAGALLIVLAVVLLYAGYLNNPLIFDDRMINGLSQDTPPVELVSRWVLLATFWLNAYFFDQQLAGYRLTNLFIHAANGVLVYLVFNRLLAAAKERLDAGVSSKVSLVGALLFVTSPAAVFAVGYLVQRSILLSTFFALITVFLFLRGQTERQDAWFAASAVSFLLSVLSKEHSVMLPGFLVVLGYWLHRQGYVWHKRWFWVFVAYTTISLLISKLVDVRAATLYEPQVVNMAATPDHAYLSSILSQTALYFKYFGLWILPCVRAMSIDIHTDLPFNILPWKGPLALVLFTTVIAAGLKLLHHRSPASILGLALAFSISTFMTEFWAVRLSEAFVIYRSYLWMVLMLPATVLTVVLLARRLSPASRDGIRRRAPLLALACIAVFGLGTLDRLSKMASPFELWSEAVTVNEGIKNPAAARPLLNLGVEYRKLGDHQASLELFQRALMHNPSYVPALMHMGGHYLHREQFSIATGFFDRALEIAPKHTGARLARAAAALRSGDLSAADRDYLAVIATEPNNPRAINNRALIAIENGHPGEAVRLLNPLVGQDGSGSFKAYFNMALALHQLGRIDEAREMISKGLIRYPETPILELFQHQLNGATTRDKIWKAQLD